MWIWEKALEIIKCLVGEKDIQYSRKVENFIDEGCYTTEDLRACILAAVRIRKCEPDVLKISVDGRKCTILGRDTFGRPFYTCGKIVLDRNDERQYFILTAHEAD